MERELLDYNRLVSTLDMLDGEVVIVRLTPRAPDESQSGAASIVGAINHTPARYEGDEFAVGSPYPDQHPEQLAGGIFFINERTFESATLWADDGHFGIAITMRRMEILVQDVNSTFP